MAVDAGSIYRDVVPLAVAAWDVRIGVASTVCSIVDSVERAESAIQFSEVAGYEQLVFERLPGVPTAFQAQCIRLLLPCLYPDDVCILSDADMVPLRREYFQDSVRDLTDDRPVIYRPFDSIPEGRNRTLHHEQVPICYVAARGSVWREVFGVSTVEEIPDRLLEWYRWSVEELGDEERWSSDQRLLHRYLTAWEADSGRECVRFSDGEAIGFRRLEVRDLLALSSDDGARVVIHPSLADCSDFHLQPSAPTTWPVLTGYLAAMSINATRRELGAGPAMAPRPMERETGNPYGTHLAPLVTAVMATSGPVLELGSGDFSTPILHALCASQGRYLLTAETDAAWLAQFDDLASPGHELVHVPVYSGEAGEVPRAELWDQIGDDRDWGVVFVDHRPGERRRTDIQRLRGSVEVMVIHDTEEPSYGLKPLLASFTSSYTYRRYSTWTTVVSDSRDVRELFVGQLDQHPPWASSGTPEPRPAEFGYRGTRLRHWEREARQLVRPVVRRYRHYRQVRVAGAGTDTA